MSSVKNSFLFQLKQQLREFKIFVPEGFNAEKMSAHLNKKSMDIGSIVRLLTVKM